MPSVLFARPCILLPVARMASGRSHQHALRDPRERNSCPAPGRIQGMLAPRRGLARLGRLDCSASAPCRPSRLEGPGGSLSPRLAQGRHPTRPLRGDSPPRGLVGAFVPWARTRAAGATGWLVAVRLVLSLRLAGRGEGRVKLDLISSPLGLPVACLFVLEHVRQVPRGDFVARRRACSDAFHQSGVSLSVECPELVGK